ncbi:hypothetical protein [Streptomyces sp. NPDC002855]|uniref:hypothetical protein n=1 Tax=Streptomyces sp. NPDC002855 TaxID=3154437 RepID=UPI003321712D
MMRYRVLNGLNWATIKGKRRAEPGDIVDDIPEKSIEWLLKQGHIEAVDPKPKPPKGGER